MTMGGRRKILFWAVGGLVAVVSLLVLAMLAAPRFLDSESMKARVEGIISQELDGQVNYQSTELSFYPRPHIEIDEPVVSIPERLVGTLDALTLYPKILPLFKGRIRVAKVELERPDIDMKLPERLAKKETPAKSRSLDAIAEELAHLLAPLALTAPDLIIVVDGGSLDLLDKGQPRFSFRDFEGRLEFPGGQFKIDLDCSSNLWGKISVQGSFDPADFTGKGEIDVAGFRSGGLIAYLLPGAGPGRLKTIGELKAATIEAGFQFNTEKATVTLTRLDMDRPVLKVNGEMLLDKASQKSSLHLALHFTSSSPPIA
jgi:hypothetical protein